MFKDRMLLIATKHEKEKVIAPLLGKELGVQCIVSTDFDTDALGTFTGEIDRVDDPLETARQKCFKAMELADCDLAIASEGSFGPHPSLIFAQSDDELLMFIDKKNDLEIFTRVITTDTNFNASEIRTKQELKDFAFKANFPSHGLIIRKSKNDYSAIEKGITNWQHLSDIFNKYLNDFGSVYVETDMRAMYNPTRMKVIEAATEKLIKKINSYCPVCNTPGLGITAVKEGLPCNLCGYPTRSILSYIYTCQKCNFEKDEKYPNQKQTEDPMYCDRCNP